MGLIERLTHEKIVSRKPNSRRATTLGLLLDSVQKIAKQETRPATEADINKAAEKLTKEALKDIELFGSTSPQAEQLREELEIYKEFLPVKLSREEIKELAEQVIGSHCSINNKKLRGHVMRSLKDTAGMDMQVLASVLDELYAQFVSTDDKEKRESVFKDIVKQEIAVQEAERIATIAAKVKAKLFEVEVEE